MSRADSPLHSHALVLAAGDGRRLGSLSATDGGIAMPNQFCSPRGGSTLLEDAIRRAQQVVAPHRVSVLVGAQHRSWWQSTLRGRCAPRAIVQPQNRGTGSGVLLALLHLERREPSARVLLIPSDHQVGDEALLVGAMREAEAHVADHPGEVVLLGLRPDQPDPQLGYIVPRPGTQSVAAVDEFVEKPDPAAACELMQRGALWNGFLACARLRTLVAWFAQAAPQTVSALRTAIARDAVDSTAGAVAALYPQLPVLDFSRDLLRGREGFLRVLAVRDCGWTDLGTVNAVTRVARQPARGTMPAKMRARPDLWPTSLQATPAELTQ
jgi:mannose-1-phosphate guanylyltransferase